MLYRHVPAVNTPFNTSPAHLDEKKLPLSHYTDKQDHHSATTSTKAITVADLKSLKAHAKETS